ncbi:related to putative multidrug transporter [Fusarium fujikuroi IMI 58289]|uniref:Related to putative multidrug transporter n=1 Tax=Gibberella fujikuroi (strain CBS 195.34 / IMI 58289 / NRRL A-6831) TaxID=1279085 RepID=S0END0_GIBF5|nr:related to putative multidrug transporter [Fusarium fujikuroi IMI 58289]CCT75494.1 related to putative multidrug transporter [Fusarium fujikuroi IMI 58289]SCO26061.1 related to putative multidrug transporter [Fusarium fujikuroi]
MEQSDARTSSPGISASPVQHSHDIEIETVKNAKENSSSKDAEALQVDEGRQPKQKKSVAFRLAFIGLSATLFVFQVDATALGIALPTIANDLKGSSLESFWANLSYTLCGLVMQPVWASISDAFGRKPPLYVCIGLFFIGSVTFAVAQKMKTIIVGRVLQGFGGGGIDVLIQVILADMTTLEERSKYLGLMGIPNAVGNILGPSVGALFSTWAGSLFPWAAWETLVPMILGVLVLAAFIFYEAKPAAPIMPHRLFHSITANMTLLGGFIHGAILVSLLQYLPLIYQAVYLETPIKSAVFLLPTSIISVFIAVISMMMVPLFGGYTWLLRLSWALLALGTGILAILNLSSPSSMLYGIPVIWGTGVALLRLNLLPMQASVKNVDDTGVAIGQFLTIRMFGGLIGLTVASAIFNTVFAKTIASSSLQLAGPLAPLEDASKAIAFIKELRTLSIFPTTLNEVLRVYLECFRTVFYTMAGLGALGLLTSMFLEEIDLKSQDRGNQRFED